MTRNLLLFAALPVCLSAQFSAAGNAFGSALGRHAASAVDNAWARHQSIGGGGKAKTQPQAKPGAPGQPGHQPAYVYLPPPPPLSYEEANPGWDYPLFGKGVKAAEAAAPKPPAPTAEILQEIHQGDKKKDVVARLGTPYSRVQLPGESGGMMEIWYYKTSEDSTGAVRLQNGVVKAVVLNN